MTKHSHSPSSRPPEVAHSRTEPDTAPSQSESGCLLRVYWMVLGNLIVAIALGRLAMTSPAFPSVTDAIFWLAVVSLAVARYADIRAFGGQTASGSPAGKTHLRRYVAILFAAAAVAWGAVLASRLS